MTKMAGAVTALAFVAACASTQKYEAIVSSWVGRPVDELVLKWGPPASQFTLESGSSVIEYRYETMTGGNSYTTTETQTHMDVFRGGLVQTPVTRTHTVPLRQWWCRTRFMVSADRVVTNYSFEGNACRA